MPTLKVLIEAKGDVNSEIPLDKWTPAVPAAQRGQSLAVQMLYEAKADLAKGEDGIVTACNGKRYKSIVTPAWIAACNGHIHVLECIAGTDAKDTLKTDEACGIAQRNEAVVKYLKSL